MNVIVPPFYPQYLGIPDVAQFEFALNDETKAVAFLKNQPCPLCRSSAMLWRICYPDRKPVFQVRCSFSGWSLTAANGCSQAGIPDPPIEDSRGAVRAWSLACKLAQ